MVGGYSFEDSKFNRATQAVRQVGSSFKVYVYADALERGATPFDTIVDLPFTTISGGQPYSPHNYDERFEGTITLRRALAGSRNVPAVKLAEKAGISTVVDMAKRFGITTPLPPYLPLALGAADMKLLEHEGKIRRQRCRDAEPFGHIHRSEKHTDELHSHSHLVS